MGRISSRHRTTQSKSKWFRKKSDLQTLHGALRTIWQTDIQTDTRNAPSAGTERIDPASRTIPGGRGDTPQKTLEDVCILTHCTFTPIWGIRATAPIFVPRSALSHASNAWKFQIWQHRFQIWQQLTNHFHEEQILDFQTSCFNLSLAAGEAFFLQCGVKLVKK